MSPAWPATDVVRGLRTAADRSVVTARTALYFQGDRHHIHTTTILIAAEQVLAPLLRAGEGLAGIAELQNRNLSDRDLLLTASDASERVPRVSSPAIRARFLTDRGRTLFLEGAVTEERVRRREAPAGVFRELMERMHLEESRGERHRTRLDPLGSAWVEGADALLGRHAIVELVLEGTRRLIRERFGDIEGQVLVVAGWRDFVFPAWAEVARGCVLEYRLSDGRLSSGARLVHCDFSFAEGPGGGRLTIGCAPEARMRALAIPDQAKGQAASSVSTPARGVPE